MNIDEAVPKMDLIDGWFVGRSSFPTCFDLKCRLKLKMANDASRADKLILFLHTGHFTVYSQSLVLGTTLTSSSATRSKQLVMLITLFAVATNCLLLLSTSVCSGTCKILGSILSRF